MALSLVEALGNCAYRFRVFLAASDCDLRSGLAYSEASDSMTLFDATPNSACRAYINLRDGTSEMCRLGRQHCEDLWRTFAPLADEHFVAEFPVRLHDRWFEMYLAVALMRAGYNVQAPKPGPDILLTIESLRIWIEATCASAGEAGKPDSVLQPHYAAPGERPVVTDRPTDEMTLRIRNSLHVKQQKFLDYSNKGIVQPKDVTAVAINVHEIPNAWADVDDLMRRTLYGLGDLVLTIDRDKRQVVDHSYAHRPAIEKKSTKEPVTLEPFTDGSLSHISAAIASWEDVVNWPPRLGDGLSLFPNVSAAIAWPAGALRLGQEWTAAQEQNGDWQLTRTSYIP